MTRSRAVNRAARVLAERSAGRGIKPTDSGGLHRTTRTCVRRRGKTLPKLNEFVACAGPIHLPGVACPPESGTTKHNNYKAKVCACARSTRVLTQCPGGPGHWHCPPAGHRDIRPSDAGRPTHDSDAGPGVA